MEILGFIIMIAIGIGIILLGLKTNIEKITSFGCLLCFSVLLMLGRKVMFYYEDDIFISRIPIRLEGHKDYANDVRVDFKTKEEDLFEKITNQYETTFNEEDKYLTIVYENSFFTLEKVGEGWFPFKKNYKYRLSQGILGIKVDNETVAFPFPSFCVDTNTLKITHKIDLNKYYEYIENAEIFEDRIEVTVDKYQLIIQTDGDKLVLKIRQ